MAMDYQSSVTLASKAAAGVEFEVARMSFGRRLELMRQVRDLSQRREFHDAAGTPGGQMESAVLSMEIDALYWRWGLQAVRGLQIDGAAVDAAAQWERGPEALTREILTAIRAEAGLSEDERKN